MPRDWHANEQARVVTGLPTVECDDAERKVMAQITAMPDGTQVVSLTVVIATGPDTARIFAERLMDAHLDVAVPL